MEKVYWQEAKKAQYDKAGIAEPHLFMWEKLNGIYYPDGRIDVTEDNFDEVFSPQKNHIDDNASFNEQMYETFGAELDFVREQDPRNVWTIIEAEGNMYYSAGVHYVNRIGYLVCEEKWFTGTEEIELDNDFD